MARLRWPDTLRGRARVVASEVLAGFLAGAILGAGLTAAWRARPSKVPAAPTDRVTSTWSLAELGAPLVVARDLDVEVPLGARVVVAGTIAPEAVAAAQVRQVPYVSGEFAVNPAKGQALLFFGGVRSGSMALPTRDQALVQRLAAEAEALWQRSEPYVERCTLGEAARREGVVVEVQGVVADVVARHGAYLIRLEEQGQALGVRVQVDAQELKGQRILVRGPMQREGGYPILVASDVRRMA